MFTYQNKLLHNIRLGTIPSGPDPVFRQRLSANIFLTHTVPCLIMDFLDAYQKNQDLYSVMALYLKYMQ